MKRLFTLIALILISGSSFAQDSKEQIMEKRAREMYRVLGLNEPGQWRKFIQENYTQALIDKPMRATVKEGNGSATTTTPTSTDNLENKVKMFQRLHDDFGSSTLSSIKIDGDMLSMVLISTGELEGTFKFKFEKEKPYKIDGLGIQAEN